MWTSTKPWQTHTSRCSSTTGSAALLAAGCTCMRPYTMSSWRSQSRQQREGTARAAGPRADSALTWPPGQAWRAVRGQEVEAGGGAVLQAAMRKVSAAVQSSNQARTKNGMLATCNVPSHRQSSSPKAHPTAQFARHAACVRAVPVHRLQALPPSSSASCRLKTSRSRSRSDLKSDPRRCSLVLVVFVVLIVLGLLLQQVAQQRLNVGAGVQCGALARRVLRGRREQHRRQLSGPGSRVLQKLSMLVRWAAAADIKRGSSNTCGGCFSLCKTFRWPLAGTLGFVG